MRLLALILCLLTLACPKSQAPKTDRTAEARTLFRTHRHALPIAPVSIPFPMEEKYWRYSADLDYPSAQALNDELLKELPLQIESQRLIRAAYLLEREVPLPAVEAAALDQLAAQFINGETDPTTQVDTDALARYLLAGAEGGSLKVLSESALESIDSTIPLEQGGLDPPTFQRGLRDLARLRLIGALLSDQQLPLFTPQLRAIAGNPASTLAFRMEAAQILYALGETNQRALILQLGFGEVGSRNLLGWSTYRFLAEQGDATMRENLVELIAAQPEAKREAYLVHLAQYGDPADFETIRAYVMAGVPQPAAEQIAPEVTPSAWGPVRALPAQDAGQSTTDAKDPHAGLLGTGDDWGSAFEYTTEDIALALKTRLLAHYTPDLTRASLHELLLKGGPATRIAAGELLCDAGDTFTLELLPETWSDTTDALVLAELAHCYLMIEARLAVTAPKSGQ